MAHALLRGVRAELLPEQMDGLFPEPLLLVDSLLLLEGLEVLDVDVEEEEELLAAAGDEFLEVSLVLEDEFDILVFV